MAIGGNPGGTAGGIKTTTFAIIVLEMRRILTGQRDLQLWDRRASRDAVERSLATLALCLIWVGMASFLVGKFNPLASAADVIFECISAFGTVGLSRGLTMSLSDPSKLVITLTMFAGRIGILTFALSLIGPKKPSKVRLPEARVPLG
jgi:trk system potassium uptake protein TrkH